MVEAVEQNPDVGAIPCDGGSRFQLALLEAAGDYHLYIVDPELELDFFPMRFRTQAGGGALPLIAEELSHILHSFSRYRGQIPPDINFFKKLRDSIPGHLELRVKTGKSAKKPKITILNLQDDDEYPPSQLIDIEVFQNGSVALTQRSVNESRTLQQAQMTFLPTELGGRYPVVAAAFTNIAERIVLARHPNSHTH